MPLVAALFLHATGNRPTGILSLGRFRPEYFCALVVVLANRGARKRTVPAVDAAPRGCLREEIKGACHAAGLDEPRGAVRRTSTSRNFPWRRRVSITRDEKVSYYEGDNARQTVGLPGVVAFVRSLAH